MLIDETLARRVIVPRPAESHKGTYGRVLLIGGLYPYGGAIIMATLACVNSGAGLVSVATDRDNIPALHAHLPEAMAFDVSDDDLLRSHLQTVDVVLIGSGLGDHALAQAVFDRVLTEISAQQTLIIDGSALNLLAQKDQLPPLTNQLILTPHQKEWERLSGIAIAEQTEENTQAALRHFPKGTVLVAKSHATKVYQGERLGVLGVGGPYQATGGMGDTLAGMIAGFAAQFSADVFETVAAATYLHSAIADQLSADAYVVLPTRISAQIPAWMKRLSD